MSAPLGGMLRKAPICGRVAGVLAFIERIKHDQREFDLVGAFIITAK